MKNRLMVRSAGVLFALFAQIATAQPIKGALEQERFGLYPAGEFHVTDGACGDCKTVKQALWYFRGDLVAVPKAEVPVAGFSNTPDFKTDIRQWAMAPEEGRPPLVWIGSPQIIEEARLGADGHSLQLGDGGQIGFGIVPKLATNRSYYDASTERFLKQRPLRLRGELQRDGEGREIFVARTVWPKDFAIRQDQPLEALGGDETLVDLVRAEQGGAQSPFATRVLWERDPGQPRDWENASVVSLMLNGAQGDDDEAHGGHFAVATGSYRTDGDWSQWLVNNFYGLDSYSEKGIEAAVTPMDKYLMDLNNGQSFYRPSYMVVAIMRSDSVARQYQGAVGRVFNHFYRHDFAYDHASANCAGISMDTFQTLGWNVPPRGPTGYMKATGAYLYVAASEGSLDQGRKIYDYLTEERTRLSPAVSFDAAGNDLLQLVSGNTSRELTAMEQILRDDVEAILFVRIPQIPSSRAYGLAPVYSFDEFMAQAPEDRSQWQIVPNEPRPFPVELRDGPALEASTSFPIPAPIAGLGVIGGLLIAKFTRRWKKRRAHGRRFAPVGLRPRG